MPGQAMPGQLQATYSQLALYAPQQVGRAGPMPSSPRRRAHQLRTATTAAKQHLRAALLDSGVGVGVSVGRPHTTAMLSISLQQAASAFMTTFVTQHSYGP